MGQNHQPEEGTNVIDTVVTSHKYASPHLMRAMSTYTPHGEHNGFVYRQYGAVVAGAPRVSKCNKQRNRYRVIRHIHHT